MSECFKGWAKEDGNSKGRCCCNCKYQTEVHSHPNNQMTGGRMRGPVASIAGWGCASPKVTDNKFIVFFEKEHSYCDVHDFKN